MQDLSCLSIIIVTWNGDTLLDNCLISLTKLYGTTPEIIVIDNAALASTAELVRAYPNVKYRAAPQNLGFAGGNNLALPLVTREFILLLNNDTVIHTDSFSPLIEFLKAHKKVGIVQGTMNIPGHGLDVCGENLRPWGLLKHRLVGRPTATTPRKTLRVSAAKGAMLMFKRQVLDSLDGILFYDHFKCYFEDIDFCLRADNVGWQTWFVDTPPIDHLCGKTAGLFNHSDIWEQYLANIIWSFWHLGLFRRFVTLPCFLCAAFIHSPRATLRAIRNASSR